MVHVSRSWSTYLGRVPLDVGVRDFVFKIGGKQPTKTRKRVVTTNLAEVFAIVLGVPEYHSEDYIRDVRIYIRVIHR